MVDSTLSAHEEKDLVTLSLSVLIFLVMHTINKYIARACAMHRPCAMRAQAHVHSGVTLAHIYYYKSRINCNPFNSLAGQTFEEGRERLVTVVDFRVQEKFH